MASVGAVRSMGLWRLASRRSTSQGMFCVLARTLPSSVAHRPTGMEEMAASPIEATSADPIPAPTLDSEEKVYPAKIEGIVQAITSLTMLEVGDLNALLKKRLNLPDAPMMPTGMMMAPGAPLAEEEEVVNVASTKTAYTVKLTGFDATKKIPLIKEIKTLVPGLNLVQAKKFVESCPQVVKADMGQDEANALKDSLIALGATIEIE